MRGIELNEGESAEKIGEDVRCRFPKFVKKAAQQAATLGIQEFKRDFNSGEKQFTSTLGQERRPVPVETCPDNWTSGLVQHSVVSEDKSGRSQWTSARKNLGGWVGSLGGLHHVDERRQLSGLGGHQSFDGEQDIFGTDISKTS